MLNLEHLLHQALDASALIYCDGAYQNLDGKTAHGLVRRSQRYRILGVIDSSAPMMDAGSILDGRLRNIPIFSSMEHAFLALGNEAASLTHLIVGLDPIDGRITEGCRTAVLFALNRRLHVVSGLNEFFSDDPRLRSIAEQNQVTIVDLKLVFRLQSFGPFTGERLRQVGSVKVAVLGTDAAVGKRTTAWMLMDELREHGFAAEFLGTGQTAWLQGARHGIILDALVNDSIPGAIEDLVWRGWSESSPQPSFLIIEGQGSLLSPAYGESLILVCARPDVVVLQHDPGRRNYNPGGYPIPALEAHIRAIESLAPTRVIAITINESRLLPNDLRRTCDLIEQQVGLTVCAPLSEGLAKVRRVLLDRYAHEAVE